MKKIFIYLVFMVLTHACQQDSVDSLDSKQLSNAYSTYLDIKNNLDYTEIINLNIEEEKVYNEAKNRFGTIVKYKNQQYYLAENNYEDINISPNLFNHFKKIMEHSNEFYKELREKGGDIHFINIAQSKTRSREEIPGNGESGFAKDWFGFSIYLSNKDLQMIALGATVGSVITGLIPDPSISKVATAACGLTAALAEYGAITSPNGIIISFIYPAPVPGGCIPYSISRR